MKNEPNNAMEPMPMNVTVNRAIIVVKQAIKKDLPRIGFRGRHAFLRLFSVAGGVVLLAERCLMSPPLRVDFSTRTALIAARIWVSVTLPLP